MKRLQLLATALFICSNVQAAPARPECAAFAADLAAMVRADQALRSRWDFGAQGDGSGPPRIVQQTQVVDKQNTENLKRLVKACGWPIRSVHGTDAVNDAWLLAQHADHDRKFQHVVLSLLQVAVAEAAFNRLASGKHVIARETAVSYVEKIIQAGLLPCAAFEPLLPDAGYLRALVPFSTLKPDLAALGAFRAPEGALAAKVTKLANDFRVAIVNRKEKEKDERQKIRDSRAPAVRSLLELQGALRRQGSQAECSTLALVASSVAEVASAMESLQVTTWMLVALPRQSLAKQILTLRPRCGPDGGPDFPWMFRWLELNGALECSIRAQALERFCDRVRSRWGVDPRQYADGRALVVDACSAWQVLDLAYTKATVDQLLSSRRLERLLPSEQRFLRRVCSFGGSHSLQFVMTLAMAENWYFGDQAEDEESDFEERLATVRRWAQLMLAGGPNQRETESSAAAVVAKRSATDAPETSDVKRLVKDLMRLDVRPVVEMNMDMPRGAEVGLPLAVSPKSSR